MDLFPFAVVLPAAAAVFDLMVGVSNDAANCTALADPSKLADSSKP